MNKKQLAKKLANHKFTVVKEATQGSKDPDVIEFKAREKQAKARAKRYKERKFNTTLACKLQGVKVAKSA